MKRNAKAPLFMVCCLMATLVGCATLRGRPTDEELISRTVNEWKASVEAQDLERMMACISEDFKGEEGGKPEMRRFLERLIARGTLEGAEMDIDDALTTIEGSTASVSSIWISTNEGGAALELDMQKDPDGAWRMVGLEAH